MGRAVRRRRTGIASDHWPDVLVPVDLRHAHSTSTNPTEATMNEPASTTRNDERLVWTVEEAGRLLGISRAHAYELVARGELPHVRLGRRVVVPKHAIEALLAQVIS
jgi:excisionase family DNA binding protein